MNVRSRPLHVLTAVALLALLAGCAVNPATGKTQLMLVSESDEIKLGRENDQQIVAEMGTYEDDELEEYVARMKPGQEPIYFVTADNWATARHSPHLEAFLAKGVEVLLLTDEIDEWVVHHLTEFDGKPLQSVAKGTVSLEGIEGADDEQAPKSDPGAHQALVEALKSCLGERVKDVRVSERLTTSPACVVADEHEMGAHLERVLRAAGQELDGAKPILEINPDHLVLHRFESERSEQRRRDLAEILLDQAVLSEGGRLGDPAAFVRRVDALIVAVADPGAEPQVEPSGAAVEPEAG